MDDNRRFSLTGGLTRRDLLKLGGATGLGSLVGGRMAAAPKSPPNIVFVFPDQQRNASWPGGGDPQVKTPNLDRMAREGAAFNHCLSTYPLCSPYRASLLTGRYPQATTITYNVGQNRGGLPTTEVTIADLLKKAGYATGYVGKWHLYPGGPQGKLVPAGAHRHGFDYWRVCHNYRMRYDTRCFDDAGKEFVLPDYAPKCQMDMTLEFIEKNARKPFCVFLSWHPPHAPYNEAPQRFVDMYRAETVKLRPNVPAQGNLRRIREAYVGYFSHVSAMDEEMGRLMKKLADLGIADNTIVCLSSDHGDMLGSFDLWAKQKPWEESINVPFIIRWPAGIPAGRRLDHLFSTPDITPTLLGLAGIPLLPRMQGVDLSGALRGKDIAGPDSAFIMARGAAAAEDADAEGQAARRAAKKAAAGKNPGEWRGVRTARFTYARYHASRTRAPWVLYDNEKDPYQMRNLVDDPTARATQKEMDALVDRWLKRLGEQT